MAKPFGSPSVGPALRPITPSSRFGPIGEWLRRAVFRAARPVIFAEHQVHLELAREITSIESSLRFPEELDEAKVLDVDSDVGKLFFHAHDTVLTPFVSQHGFWERDEGELLRALLHPGDTFLDVGANVGYTTILGARGVGTAGEVIAIEPDGQNLQLLRANLWRHGVSARILPVAAYSRAGFLGFVRNETNPANHQVREGPGQGALVPCARVDELLAGLHVDVAKVDAEGVDHEVIDGMVGLLHQNPAIVVLSEFHLKLLEERNVDPWGVLDGYRRLRFAIGLLEPGGVVRPATAQEVVDACRSWEGLFVNLVLVGPERNLADL